MNGMGMGGGMMGEDPWAALQGGGGGGGRQGNPMAASSRIGNSNQWPGMPPMGNPHQSFPGGQFGWDAQLAQLAALSREEESGSSRRGGRRKGKKSGGCTIV